VWISSPSTDGVVPAREMYFGVLEKSLLSPRKAAIVGVFQIGPHVILQSELLALAELVEIGLNLPARLPGHVTHLAATAF